MGRRNEITCDGCGQKQFTKPPMAVPPDWAEITITFDGFKPSYPSLGANNGPHQFDLCAGCQMNLVKQALPSRWGRIKEVEPEKAA